MRKKVIALLPFLMLSMLLSSQTSISGTVNDYFSVSAINVEDYEATTSGSNNLNPDDLVLIIQMQGATIDQSQSNSFGSISNYNAAGTYEFQRVCSKQGNQVYFNYPFKNNYDVNGKVQLIKVPEFQNGARLTGILSGTAWDGSKGGVLAIKSNGTIDLDQFSITMTGKGFRGGQALSSGGGCIFVSPTTYHSSRTSNNDRALKGEGIAEYITGKECSRGPQANGGGGGNNHNGGGSGGSNYGIGGAGGQRVKSSSFSCGSVTGLNSMPLDSAINAGRMFMGGGGGAGHGNNAGLVGESGENGGGIIFIIAPEVIGTNRSGIFANGNTGSTNSENEGGGGGGAGGSVILDVPSITSAINIATNGGNGVFVTNFGTNCSGPGGGGGGGVVAFSSNSIPSAVIVNTSGGSTGEIASSSQAGCAIGDKNGATAGTNGTTLTNFSIEDNTVNRVIQKNVFACDKYSSSSGKTWTEDGTYRDTVLNAGGCENLVDFTLSLSQLDTGIEVTKYVDGVHDQLPVTWKSKDSTASYQWYFIDSNGDTVKLVDETNQSIDMDSINGAFGVYFVVLSKNGCTDTSETLDYLVGSTNDIKKQQDLRIVPNPSKGKFVISTQDLNIQEVTIYGVDGREIKTLLPAQANRIEGEVHQKGTYILRIKTEDTVLSSKLIIN